jgi:hypothetical protein
MAVKRGGVGGVPDAAIRRSGASSGACAANDSIPIPAVLAADGIRNQIPVQDERCGMIRAGRW